MTVNEACEQLKALADEKTRAHNLKYGAPKTLSAQELDRLVRSVASVHEGCTSSFAPIWINAMVSRQG
jgi:hypothetical protein